MIRRRLLYLLFLGQICYNVFHKSEFKKVIVLLAYKYMEIKEDNDGYQNI